MNMDQISEEAAQEFPGMNKEFRDHLVRIIKSAIEKVRAETLAECRAECRALICDLKDKIALALGLK